MVSEGEILDAIHRPLGARSLDGVKRRTRAGIGALPVRLLLSKNHGDPCPGACKGYGRDHQMR